MIGPVLGSMIYASLGYEKTFFVFAGMLLLSCCFVFFILPSRMNKIDENLEAEAEADQEGGSIVPEKEITFKMFIFNPRAMMAIISSAIAMIFMLFYNGILSVHLQENLHMDPTDIGYIFALGCLTYALSSPLVSIVFRGVPRRFITQLAFIVSTVALFLFGPSELLGFPE